MTWWWILLVAATIVSTFVAGYYVGVGHGFEIAKREILGAYDRIVRDTERLYALRSERD